MVWYTLIYIVALLISLYLLLSSRHLVTIKRWYDFSFMLGNVFFLWGLGHLLSLHPNVWYQMASGLAYYLFYIFLLLAFRTFPMPPHLYYDRWKNNFDILLITVLHITIQLEVWLHPDKAPLFIWISHFQTSLFIFGTCITIFQPSWLIGRYQANNWLLIGSMLFLLFNAMGPILPEIWSFVIAMSIFAIILISHYRMRDLAEKLMVADESRYLYQRFTFALRDERIHWLYLFGTVAGLGVTRTHERYYLIGMAVFSCLLLIRCYKTKLQNKLILTDLFTITLNLENHFAKNLEQLQSKNTELYQLLDGKQRYAKLLQVSNEKSVQQIHFDNLYVLTEEYVQDWYSILEGFPYVRLSFQSATYEIYYETTRGVRSLTEDQLTIERLVVDENEDSPHIPRYVVVEVEGAINQDQLVFVQQLAAHTRRLLQRCIQNQQSMDIRLIEQEMALASRIQSSLIPKERLQIGMVQVKAVYLPMDYVGGDYVDFVVIDERYSCYLIADISGHGVPASLLTTGIRNLFRAVLQVTIAPEEILTRLNQLLYEDLSTTRSYVTMFIAVIDQQEQVIRTSKAGHPDPIYLSKSKQQLLPSKRGMGLGLIKDAKYEREELSICEDFILLLYTDGLTDLSRKKEGSDAPSWFERLSDWYVSTDQLPDRIEEIEQLIFEETARGEQSDDITVLIVEIQARRESKGGGTLHEAM